MSLAESGELVSLKAVVAINSGIWVLARLATLLNGSNRIAWAKRESRVGVRV